MTDVVSFDQIRPLAPDLDGLADAERKTQAALVAVRTVEEALAILRDWDAARAKVATYEAWVDLAFQRDTTDAGAKAVREAWEAVAPRWTELQVRVKRSLLRHPLRGALESSIGAQAFALWEADVLSFDPELQDDLVREATLKADYTELLAGATLTVGGERHTLTTIAPLRQHASRGVRHQAERALWDWFASESEPLDQVFDELVGLRTRMARTLGGDDYVGLGYRRLGRTDYGPQDVARFRATIRDEVVPLATELTGRQARELGVERLMAWDEAVHDLRGNPTPKGNGAWLLERAQHLFDELGGPFGSFFRRMHEGGFLDLESRRGKAGGGFCTAFPSHGMPYVFANFNGTKADVEVLTHEIGHAFQAYQSRTLWPSDYLWPTLEACEVHSMGLEFLAWPHMEAFFREDAERFRRVHLVEAILFLPYAAAVDHFQHEVYANPSASPAERHAIWREMERVYLPWRDWGDLDYPSRGGRWQHQRHVYQDPFYYIDYALAQTCALQLWARARVDRAAALETYLALCQRGGAEPFQALVEGAGLRSPFASGSLAEVVASAREHLGLGDASPQAR